MNKIKLINILYLILSGIILTSCLDDDNITTGQFPEIPVNFEEINSEFDDYNAALPYDLYNEFPLIFSSNRESEGENFNLVNFIVSFYYIESTNTVYFNASDQGYDYYDSLLLRINTLSNEYGPVMLFDYQAYKDIYLYSSDTTGNLDIYYVAGDNLNTSNLSDAVSINKLNTSFNEAYPTINKSGDKIYFCSDSTGNFDIYHVELSNSLYTWLQTEEIPVWTPANILNNSSNDKCPYINRNVMVFTSDRDGGYGGYDLYYSEFVDGNWTEPINFGEEINSEYDEYRPVIMYAPNYINDLMFFSSNRTGGLGGYDLYYVGIPKMIL